MSNDITYEESKDLWHDKNILELMPGLMKSISFKVFFHPDENKLIELMKSSKNNIEEYVKIYKELRNESSLIIGYNKENFYLSLSEPFKNNGTFVLIENKFYYCENIPAIREERDNYRMGDNNFYTTMNFRNIVEYFSNKYGLLKTEEITFFPEIRCTKNLENAIPISLDKIL